MTREHAVFFVFVMLLLALWTVAQAPDHEVCEDSAAASPAMGCADLPAGLQDNPPAN